VRRGSDAEEAAAIEEVKFLHATRQLYDFAVVLARAWWG
jgi:hypothetical protein